MFVTTSGVQSKPRQPMVRVVMLSRPRVYTYERLTEEGHTVKDTSSGFEIVEEHQELDVNWAEAEVPRFHAPAALMFGLAEQFTDKGLDLLTSGRIMLTKEAKEGCVGTRRQDVKKFRQMAHFQKMIEMSRDYLDMERKEVIRNAEARHRERRQQQS